MTWKRKVFVATGLFLATLLMYIYIQMGNNSPQPLGGAGMGTTIEPASPTLAASDFGRSDETALAMKAEAALKSAGSSAADLNASVIPIHEHSKSSETGLVATSLGDLTDILKIADPEERAVALDRLSEAVLLLSATQRSRIALTIIEMSADAKPRVQAGLYDLLKSIAPIGATDGLLELYESSDDAFTRQTVIETLGYTVEDLRGDRSLDQFRVEYQQIQDFFLSNLGTFGPGQENYVLEALHRIFTPEELTAIGESGQLPKSREALYGLHRTY